MRRYNITLQTLIIGVLGFLLVIILLISGLSALFGGRDKDGKDKNGAAGATVSASPSPSALPTHSPRPSSTPDGGTEPSPPPTQPPVTSSTPAPDAPGLTSAAGFEILPDVKLPALADSKEDNTSPVRFSPAKAALSTRACVPPAANVGRTVA